MSYPQHQPPNGQAYYGPSSQSAYQYGNVSYALNQGGEMGQVSMDPQRHGLETIRNLVADTRAGSFDTNSYAQIGTRLAAIANSNLAPISGGPITNFQSQAGGGGDACGPQLEHPIIPNLRTRDELLEADRIFTAMQTTIYENANAITAVGLGQLDGPYVQAMGQRHSHSPPGLHLPSTHNANYVPNMDRGSPHSNNSGGTPALTPPSSAHSGTDGNSPAPLHNNNRYQQAPPAAMYPTLPGASADVANRFGGAHIPTLGAQLDNSHRRRYSGGRLQKARPLHNDLKCVDSMDVSKDDAATPGTAAVPSSSAEVAPTDRQQNGRNFSSSNLDPALGGIASPSGEMDEVSIRENEMWVTSARTIEALRAWISKLIQNNEIKNDEEEQVQPKQEPSLYPVLTEA